jgi:hypothetical protein
MRNMSQRSRTVLFAGSALLVAAVAFGAWRSTSGKTMALNGVALTAPAGWDRESFVNRSGMAVFRLGSYHFRHARDDDVGQVARASMGPRDILINIIDVTPTEHGDGRSYYEPAGLPLVVRGSEATGQEGYTNPAAVIRGVRVDGHDLYVSVAFGQAPPSDAQVAAANAALRTLTLL